MSWQSQGIALLAGSLVRPFALVAGAWCLIRAFRVRHPSSQHAVWTAVLLGMLLLPAVSVLTPHWNLPLLPHPAATGATIDLPHAISIPSGFQAPVGGLAPYASTAASAKLAGRFNLPIAATMILAGYFVGLSAMLIYWAVGLVLLGRLISRSRRLRTPRLRESADLVSPVTAGVLRPIVILPAGWRTWKANVRQAVLAHEFAHIRRHDHLALTLSRLVECVFWFHPLAWWLSRKTMGLSELACDAAVIETTNDPGGYSRTLIAFAEAVHRTGHRAKLPGLAMARPGAELGRRIDQLFELSRKPMRKLSSPALVLTMIGVPLLCLAATTGVREHHAPAQPYNAAFTASNVENKAPNPAQSPKSGAPEPSQSHLPAFEVVSIKPSVQSAGAGEVDIHIDGAQIHLHGLSLREIIRFAYTLKNYQISGPAWLASDTFDIDATLPRGATRDQIPAMLQTLLTARFAMTSHRQSQPLPVLALLQSRGGAKLKPSTGGAAPASGSAGTLNGSGRGDQNGVVFNLTDGASFALTSDRIKATGITMGVFADTLSRFTPRPVVDETRLSGRYDLTLPLAPDDYKALMIQSAINAGVVLPVEMQQLADAASDSSLFGAIEANGLKLEARKAPLEMMVVDHIQKSPTPN